MMPMQKSPGGFRAAWLAGWTVLSAAGGLYARQKNIAAWAAVPIILAFLIEYLCYLVPGFQPVLDWLQGRLSKARLAAILAASALAPYLIYSLPTGQFVPGPAVRLSIVVVLVSFWYLFRQPTIISDLALMAAVAAVVISRFFQQIYLSPAPGLPLDMLGHLMLIRLTATVVILFRGVRGTGFGFIPNRREWHIGIRHFFYFLPIGFPAAFALKLIRFQPAPGFGWKMVLLFFGILWVTALSEEFFFRGLLQQWITDWTRRPHVALVLASMVFGLCHLWYRSFPNWRFAIISALAGWFYGRAYSRAGGIRASMVTHALVVTAWRGLLA